MGARLAAMLLVVGGMSATAARAQSAIGLDLGLYLDDIAIEDSQRIGPQHEITREDRSNVDLTAGALYYLHHVGAGDGLGGFRVGGEFRYLGEYATERDGDDRDKQVVGTSIDAGVQGIRYVRDTTFSSRRFEVSIGVEIVL